jgi:hypothetical protein
VVDESQIPAFGDFKAVILLEYQPIDPVTKARGALAAVKQTKSFSAYSKTLTDISEDSSL